MNEVADALMTADWLPKDGVARLILGAVLGAIASAIFTMFRERGARALARRAAVADRFLEMIMTTLESRLQATRHEISTDARLVIASQMLRSEVKTAWRRTSTLTALIEDLERRVRFEQPAPSTDLIARESAELIATWVQHPWRTRFSRFKSK